MSRQSVVSSEKRSRGFSKDSERSFMNIMNKMRPRTLPWGTPALTGKGEERVPLAMRVEEVSNPRVELALDSIGRQFVE